MGRFDEHRLRVYSEGKALIVDKLSTWIFVAYWLGRLVEARDSKNEEAISNAIEQLQSVILEASF